ncbi:MAG: hypothetical protein JSV66_00920 [Trueperaceae bacterium]|nr:MAG: hypothetical protein JSV66_00920 [Trueperaceae bacterium]
MKQATLHGIEGVGELHVTRSDGGTDVKGLWYLSDSEHFQTIIRAYEVGRPVIYLGPVEDPHLPEAEVREVEVKIRSVDTQVDEATGEVQVTASLYAVGLATELEGDE